nr:xylulose kinase [Salmonella sp. NCTC 7297]
MCWLRITEKLTVSRSASLMGRKQEPEQWWQATDRAVKGLGRQQSLSGVRAFRGLQDKCMARRCWIAGSRFCVRRFYGMTDAVAKSAPGLEKQAPQSRAITGNLMMPGFTAPKLVLGAAPRAGYFSAR